MLNQNAVERSVWVLSVFRTIAVEKPLFIRVCDIAVNMASIPTIP